MQDPTNDPTNDSDSEHADRFTDGPPPTPEPRRALPSIASYPLSTETQQVLNLPLGFKTLAVLPDWDSAIEAPATCLHVVIDEHQRRQPVRVLCFEVGEEIDSSEALAYLGSVSSPALKRPVHYFMAQPESNQKG